MTKTTITPFVRGKVWWARVPQVGGRAIARTLDTTDKTTAELMCQFLIWLRGQREGWLLSAFAKGTAKIGPAFDAWRDNVLPAYLHTLKHTPTDADLEPWVAKWLREMERLDHPRVETRIKYVTQIRTLIPEGVPFPASRLLHPDTAKPNKDTITEWLRDKGRTARHYHAALSAFCRFLSDDESVLPVNPAKLVKIAKPKKVEPRYLDQDEAQRVIDALSGSARAYHALAAATALETQALLRLTLRDIDVPNKTVLARATKNEGRPRTATVYWRWEWAWQIFATWLKAQPLLPDAVVFSGFGVGLSEKARGDWYYRELKPACKAVGIPHYTTHDWRHTWAVQAIRHDRFDIQTVSHQLGHSNPTVTLNVYGRYRPTIDDFRRDHTAGRTVAAPPSSQEASK